MEALLIILSIVAAFWLLRRLFPLLLLWLLSRQQRRFAEQFGQQAGGAQGDRSRGGRARKEGEVKVESTPVEQTVSRSVGEYVEFEEEQK